MFISTDSECQVCGLKKLWLSRFWFGLFLFSEGYLKLLADNSEKSKKCICWLCFEVPCLWVTERHNKITISNWKSWTVKVMHHNITLATMQYKIKFCLLTNKQEMFIVWFISPDMATEWLWEAQGIYKAPHQTSAQTDCEILGVVLISNDMARNRHHGWCVSRTLSS